MHMRLNNEKKGVRNPTGRNHKKQSNRLDLSDGKTRVFYNGFKTK